MIVHVPDVLGADLLQVVRQSLLSASWVDGRVSAGHQGQRVKNNHQLAENDPLAIEIGDRILAALERHPLFISAVLPNRVYPPMFNRYGVGMGFGDHIDNAVRMVPGGGKIRTDVSVTLFLSSPDEYDGGELLIDDSTNGNGCRAIRLPAGDAIVYPATHVHRVQPVTRGARIASFFWVQSLIRDTGQRRLLYDLDRAVQRLEQTGADEAACVSLAGCYHNLLRLWSEP